jgi:hypothetical protein
MQLIGINLSASTTIDDDGLVAALLYLYLSVCMAGIDDGRVCGCWLCRASSSLLLYSYMELEMDLDDASFDKPT